MSEQRKVHRKKLTSRQRREREKRRRMRRLKRRLKFIIPVALLGIAACVFLYVVVFTGKSQDVKIGGSIPTVVVSNVTQEPISVNQNLTADQPEESVLQTAAVSENVIAEVELTDEPTPETTAQPTPEPTTEPTQTPTPEPTRFVFDDAYAAALNGEITGEAIQAKFDNVDPEKRSRWPAITDGQLPVFLEGEGVEEKIICVTVDDCYQGENLQKIVKCAISNDAKLTIFPIGENLEKDTVASAVKIAWENGMEIENHTYTHQGLYHFDDEQMTDELWNQNMQLNKCLGVAYQEHFFRPHGGDERFDQRDHKYISQMGMYGIAIWNKDGSNSSINTLRKSLEPGNIYLFHTTDNDMDLLLKFIPYAVSQGYKLVTMNDMFGLPENETSDLASFDTTKPELESFRVDTVTLKNPTYMRAVAVIQKPLHELGWLEDEPSGYFGPATEAAVKAFQEATGLDADGIAGVSTCQALLSDSARKAA